MFFVVEFFSLILNCYLKALILADEEDYIHSLSGHLRDITKANILNCKISEPIALLDLAKAKLVVAARSNPRNYKILHLLGLATYYKWKVSKQDLFLTVAECGLEMALKIAREELGTDDSKYLDLHFSLANVYCASWKPEAAALHYQIAFSSAKGNYYINALISEMYPTNKKYVVMFHLSNLD